MGKTRSILLWLVLLAGLCRTASANGKIPAVPFEIGEDNRIYVTVLLNGHSRPLRFLFDTGASDIVLNRNSPAAAGLVEYAGTVRNIGPGSEEEVRRSAPEQTVRVGEAAVSGLSVIELPYPPEAWDGVLGQSFLRNFNVEISYSEQVIRFHSPGSVAPDSSWTILPVSWRLGIPAVPAEIVFEGKNYPVLLSLDSGSDRVLDLHTPFVDRHGLAGQQTPFAISTVSGTSEKSGNIENVFFETVSLGGLVLYRIPGGLSRIAEGVHSRSDLDGVLGNNLLQRFDQIYDFRENRLYLRPNNRLYRPFYDFLIP